MEGAQVSLLKDRRGRPWTHLDPTKKLDAEKIINPVPQKWERIMDEGGEGLGREDERERGKIGEISPDRRAGL